MKHRKTATINHSASVHLDMVRGVAALAVMIGHLRGLFFVDYADVGHKSPGIKLAYFLTGLGHQAVIVFFVLSGFFIASSVIPKIAGQSWSWRPYLIARLSRLYLVLIPALVLCVFWDRWGMIASHFSAAYTRPVALVGKASVIDQTSTAIFLGNLFFLQLAHFPVFGSDSPLWSLSYEFWYYMIFPILLMIVSIDTNRKRRIGYIALVAAMAWLIGPSIRLYFSVWLCGAAVSYLHGSESGRDSPASPLAMSLSALALFAALSMARVGAWKSVIGSDLIVGATFALWVLLLTRSRDRPLPALYTRSARSLAGFSYTLYLVHFPLLFFLRACLLHGHLWQPSGRSVLWGLCLFSVVMVYAYAIASVTEAKTGAVRAYLMSRIAGAQRVG